MKLLMRCAAALVLAGALAGVGLAQDQSPPQGPPPGQDQGPPDQGGGHGGGHHGGAVRAACQADIAKLCSADESGGPGHGAFRCLRDHQDAVSDSCKSAMAAARAERQAHGGWSRGQGGQGGGPNGGGGQPDDGGPSNGGQPQN